MKVLFVIGTRPEAIKLAPVIDLLGKDPERFETHVCITAQHKELITPILDDLAIRRDSWLDAMSPGQSLAALAGRVFLGLDHVVAKEKPDWMVVQGDTTTAVVGAVTGHYLRVPVAHVEAGLRSGSKFEPFPEEANRRMATIAADVHFAPSEDAKNNLLAEGVADEDIVVTGNTVLDTLRMVLARPKTGSDVLPFMRNLRPGARIVLVTAHRRESIGEPLRNICAAIRTLAARYEGSVHFALPVHLNPQVKAIVTAELAGARHVSLLEPLPYSRFVELMALARLCLTDSGGIQEEAPFLQKPVLVLRDRTERPEGVAAGCAELVGSDPEKIVARTAHLLDDHRAWRAMAQSPCPYGDGHAAERIIETLAARAALAGAPA